MDLTYHILDVFTATRFHGNPLAVVEGADQLSGDQMQAIAKEFNLPETIFVCQANDPGHSARVRIFTPGQEVPFAGHPTIGVAILLAELTAPNVNGEQDALIVLEQNIGIVRVGVRLREDGPAFAEFRAPVLPEEVGDLAETENLAAAVGLIPNEIGFENHRPMICEGGNRFAFIPVRSLEAIGRARVESSAWATAFDEHKVLGVYLYCRQCVHTTSSFHARMFAPGAGVPEDAATGSAVVCLASAIQKFDILVDGNHRRPIEQGYEMGRPSHIDLIMSVKGGNLQSVRIGGSAVRVARGKLATD